MERKIFDFIFYETLLSGKKWTIPHWSSTKALSTGERKEAEGKIGKRSYLPLSGFLILPIKPDSVYKSCLIIKDKLSGTEGKKKGEGDTY